MFPIGNRRGCPRDPILAVAHRTESWLSPNPTMVIAAYVPYWILPMVLVWRVRRHRPFDRLLVDGR